jgi:hypothetical protein
MLTRIGLSQGNLVLRGYIQQINEPPVHKFICTYVCMGMSRCMCVFELVCVCVCVCVYVCVCVCNQAKVISCLICSHQWPQQWCWRLSGGYSICDCLSHLEIGKVKHTRARTQRPRLHTHFYTHRHTHTHFPLIIPSPLTHTHTRTHTHTHIGTQHL